MNENWLKKIISGLNRSDGMVIMAVIALMLMMIIMGGVFSSIMSDWKVSSPMAIHSNRATQLANSAASYALQEANNKIALEDSTDPVVCGTRIVPIEVIDDGVEGKAYYWIERPFETDDALAGAEGPDDDEVPDDDDDGTFPNRYTIIATGKVESGGLAVAQRQIKIFFDITKTPNVDVWFLPAAP